MNEEDDTQARLYDLASSAALTIRNKLFYHPFDGRQHPNGSDTNLEEHGPPCFWLCSPCLECDQRQLDCLADIGCGDYDENYGSYGPHPLSAVSFVDLPAEQYAAIRTHAQPAC